MTTMASSSSRHVSVPMMSDSSAGRGLHTDGDGDSFYVVDCRRIQENIRMIQSAAVMTYKICGSGGATNRPDNDIFTTINAAKNAAVETQGMLRRLRDHVQISRPDRAQRQLMYSKLGSSFQEALKSLEVVATSQVLREHLDKSSHNPENNEEGVVGSFATTRRPPSGRTDAGYSSYTSSNYEYASGGSCEDEHRMNREEEDCSRQQPISASSPVPLERQYPTSAKVPTEYHPLYLMEGGSGEPMYHSQFIQQKNDLTGFTVWSTDLEHEMLKERDKGIIQIKKDIQGIQRLYQEMAFHVHDQGKGIDNIESQMRTAAEHSARATTEVARARTYQSSRTRNLVILFLLLVVMLVILIVATRNA